MNTFLRPKGMNTLDDEIARLANQLSCMSPVEEDYAKIASNLKTLCEARERKNDRTLSAETLLAVGANILGILIILNFEKTGIVTSKAMSFLRIGK